MIDAGVSRAKARSEIAFGDAAREIIAASDRLEADLVVMGRRTSGNLRRSVLGSVVNAVLRDATCPVLVVPE
jgi:nucleotide-binding universal stress UspA family protein